MKIQPLGNRIQLQIEKVEAGGLDTSSVKSAVEYGTVIAVGPDVKGKIKKGDKVFYKSWAADIITHKNKQYIFIMESTQGICAIVD